MTKVEWPEFAACLAEMMKGDEEETAYRECFRWILLLFVVVVVVCLLFVDLVVYRECFRWIWLFAPFSFFSS